MDNKAAKTYKDVPQEQIARWKTFRSTHSEKKQVINGVIWEYISCGQGEETLLLLPGGTGIGQAFFILIMGFEKEYRIISPLYPIVITMHELQSGLERLLDIESVPKNVNILGQYFGGMVSQIFAYSYPDRVNKLILSHTTTSTSSIAPQYVKRLKLAQRIFKVIPMWLIRYLYNKEIDRLIEQRSDYQDELWRKEFWRAYFRESFALTTKQHLLSNYACQVDYFRNEAFSKDNLMKWPGKVLILEAENDMTIKPEERKAVRDRYSNAQVHTFPGAGHLDHLFYRKEFIAIVRAFLKSS